MNRVAYLVILGLSLVLPAECSSGPQAAATPSAKTAAPTAASLSAAPAVPPPTGTAMAIPSTSPARQATLTGAPAVSPGADWKLYQDQSRGFEFRYPAACSVAQSDGAFTVGGRIELVVADGKGLTLQDYVSQFMDERAKTNGWKLESQRAVTLGQNNGVRVDYRFGGTNRFGTAVFIEQKGQEYIWGLTAGGFTCDEGDAFDGIVSSFRSAR